MKNLIILAILLVVANLSFAGETVALKGNGLAPVAKPVFGPIKFIPNLLPGK